MKSGKILELAELVDVREKLRATDKTVVQCHGCFDIVHPGHIRYLRYAREQGDILIVTVSGDDVVNKGVERPYVTEDLRAENLAALEMVDYVCLDHCTWAGPALEALTPDIYVKGKEYEEKNDTRFARERHLVEKSGGRVIFSSGDVVFSSTQIVESLHEGFPLELPKIEAFCRRSCIDRGLVEKALKSLSTVSLAVVGDAIMDKYVHCETTGLAAEAPVLNVTPTGTKSYVGGVGLIALQAAALGAQVRFITAASEGPGVEQLQSAFDQAGVEFVVIEAERRPVGEKTRYLIEERKVLKVDCSRPGSLSTASQRKLTEEIQSAFNECGGVVASDFGFGTFSGGTVAALADYSAEMSKPLFVDVSQGGDASILKFHGARLATPTEDELRFAFGDRGSGLSNLAARYYAATDVERLLVTMGRRGVVLFGGAKEAREGRLTTEYLPSLATRVIDSVGAGDVFLAALSVCDIAKIALPVAAYLASAVSAAHLRKLGNAPVSLARLDCLLDSRSELT